MSSFKTQSMKASEGTKLDFHSRAGSVTLLSVERNYMAKQWKGYCVVWRIGGTMRWEWKHTLPTSFEQARQQKHDIERMGYKCYLYDYRQLQSIGVPDSFE